MPSIAKGAVFNLQRDQYKAYTIIIKSISASQHIGQLFFITSPRGTRKSFLLKAL
jgi:ABC-type iron transport system FetAB ATPase subunit